MRYIYGSRLLVDASPYIVDVYTARPVNTIHSDRCARFYQGIDLGSVILQGSQYLIAGSKPHEVAGVSDSNTSFMEIVLPRRPEP